MALDGRQQVGEWQRVVILDVAGDLRHVAARGERQADRPQPGQPLGATLADRLSDGARVGAGRGRAELEVEGHERRARADERRAGGRVHRGGAEVGLQAVGHALLETGRTTGAQLGPRSPARERAVKEDGQAERAEQIGQRERLGGRRAALVGRAVYDRGDIEGADVRMQAGVGGEIDALDRRAGPGGARLVQDPGRRREREHATMVVGIRVAIEDPRSSGPEGFADRIEHVVVAPFGDVGDREQHLVGLHERT